MNHAQLLSICDADKTLDLIQDVKEESRWNDGIITYILTTSGSCRGEEARGQK